MAGRLWPARPARHTAAVAANEEPRPGGDGEVQSGERVARTDPVNPRSPARVSPNVITTSLGADRVDAGGGPDTVAGGRGSDLADGSDGDDALAGGSGDDGLAGGPGSDVLDGEGGADRCDGGPGTDRLISC